MAVKELNDTQNIYAGWFEVICEPIENFDGTPSGMTQLKSLQSFSKEEIQHLIWLLNEELKQKG